MSKEYFFELIASPVGPLFMIVDGAGVMRVLEFQDREERWRPTLARRFEGATLTEKPGAFDHAATLSRYFDGDIEAIDAIATKATGSDFQLAVWQALREIPAGTTTSYGAIARKLGKPTPCARSALQTAQTRSPLLCLVTASSARMVH